MSVHESYFRLIICNLTGNATPGEEDALQRLLQDEPHYQQLHNELSLLYTPADSRSRNSFNAIAAFEKIKKRLK
jgi:hypothetical protein